MVPKRRGGMVSLPKKRGGKAATIQGGEGGLEAQEGALRAGSGGGPGSGLVDSGGVPGSGLSLMSRRLLTRAPGTLERGISLVSVFHVDK